MKTVYIPAGATYNYETLVTDDVIVHGHLHVTNGLKAKHISGRGFLTAGEVSADIVDVTELECSTVICRRLMTSKPRGMLLTLLLSMLRTFWLRLTASRSRGKFEKPRTKAPKDETADTPEDTELKANIAKVVQEVLAQQAAEKAACADDANEADDFELQRMVSTFKLLRSKGYTLRILPGTPEENAPVFDFAAESIQPAA